jgi:signal transduction histidine kinase
VESGELGAHYATPVEISLREVSRLESVVRGVLSLGRRREPRREHFPLHRALQDSVEACAGELQALGIEVDQRIEECEVDILGDSGELEGAFVNLLRNAGEAMPGGGRVRIWTETTAPKPVDRPGSVRIHVVDEGPGIPPELRETVFDPFVSTKDGGTGFGLALAMQAVEGHGGSIVLQEPAPGQGAHFVVELPLTPAGRTAEAGDGCGQSPREEAP